MCLQREPGQSWPQGLATPTVLALVKQRHAEWSRWFRLPARARVRLVSKTVAGLAMSENDS